MNKYFSLTNEQQITVIRQAANRKGLPVQAVEKAKRSSTDSSEDGEYLLLAVPERYNEIIDVEVID